MANTFIYQMTDTWANATQTFVAINMNVTDTASTANSALLNLAVGGANQFTVLKSGDLFAAGGIGANTTHTNLLGDGIVFDYNPAAFMGRIMVGAGDGFTFYSGNSTAVGANSVMLTISNTGVTSMGNTTANVQLGGITTLGTPAVVTGAGNSNSSISIIVSNANTGGNTSADFAAYDGSGLTGVNFIDMGITSNTWSNTAWTIGGASDGYLYTGNTNLSIGTAGGAGSNGFINFFTRGTLIANERMRIAPGGNVGIANTAPDATLAVTGTANVSGAVRLGSTLTVASNTLTLGTSTATAANGYSFLPNGLKVNWGWVAANNTGGNVTFTSAFGTACLSVMLTSANATANGPYLIQPANTTVAPIRTASATAGNVAYFAIGY
jgi:hypothetical protein